jgi:hypothetical protein
MLYLAASILHVPATEKQALLEVTYAHELLVQVVRLYRREAAVLRRQLGEGEDSAPSAAWLN